MEIWLIAAVVVTAAVAVYSLLNRRRGEVIDAPRQAQTTTATAQSSAPPPAPAAASGDMSAGDMLKAEGADEPLEHFADWLESAASEELGTAVEQPGPTRRIADAARAIMPVILGEGRGVVSLPGLVVDASGGRDFQREIDIARLERAVVDMGLLDVHELTDWRKDPMRVKGLAAWLVDQVDDDMPTDGELVDDDTVRIVEAARQAAADLDRTGRADIALLEIGKDETGRPFDTRRSIDATEAQSIVAAFEENERVTTRTRKWVE